MSAKIQIRPMLETEMEEVLQLWRKTCAATYHFLQTSHTEEEDHAYFTTVIAAKNQIWVAELEGKIAGFLAIRENHLDRLYVAPKLQRIGIGRALLDHAKTLSPVGLTLCTHQKNTAARQFYEVQGFVAVRFGISPAPENEPDVEYRWEPINRPQT